MAVGQKPLTEIILRYKITTEVENQLKRNERSSGQLRSVSARFGPAHQARLGWTSLRPAQANSAHLGPARHSFGGVWLLLAELIEPAWLRLSLVRLALDKVNPKPGLAAKVVILQSKHHF